jgi:hypothetical protein
MRRLGRAKKQRQARSVRLEERVETLGRKLALEDQVDLENIKSELGRLDERLERIENRSEVVELRRRNGG